MSQQLARYLNCLNNAQQDIPPHRVGYIKLGVLDALITRNIMKSKFDLNAFLDQTFFGLDIQTMLGDVEDFVEFSERNIGWQKNRELRRAEHECDVEEFDAPSIEAQYRDQTLEDVEYRFEVSLKQRVRYAALTALITTVEWCLISLKNRASFDFPKKPKSRNEAVHILSTFNDKMALGLEAKIQFVENLAQARNCIIHAAGLLNSYQYESQLRESLDTLHGMKVSNINFLGESIEIEPGFLENTIEDFRLWLPQLEKTAIQHGHLRK